MGASLSTAPLLPRQCARVDSNHHGEISPQGPQPDTGGVDASAGVQIGQIARFSGRIGRVWKGGCSQSVLTGAGFTADRSAGMPQLRGLDNNLVLACAGSIRASYRSPTLGLCES